MRTYMPMRSEAWPISRDRYRELISFCRQYPVWKVEAADALELSGPSGEPAARGGSVSDPTYRGMLRRDRILGKITLVERCALAPEGGAWYQALILNVCNGMSWEMIRDLHPEALKSSDRRAYFRARRLFFVLLDREKE